MQPPGSVGEKPSSKPANARLRVCGGVAWFKTSQCAPRHLTSAGMASLQDFAGSVPATGGLIAAPRTPLASLCFPLRKRTKKADPVRPVDQVDSRCKVELKTPIS